MKYTNEQPRWNPEHQPPPPIGFNEPESPLPLVSVVIPVFNAEGSIESLCDRLIDELTGFWRIQIVLVDDGSTDRSAAACQRLRETHGERITFIQLARNFGEHNAVMAGLNYADGDYCVIMDDDFQNPPSEVHKMLVEIAKGYDVVYSRYQEKMHHPFRNLASRLHNRMASWVLNKPADLYLSSFKVMSRFVVQQVIQYTGPDPYLDAIILRTTRNIGAVTVQHHNRQQGESGYTLAKLVSLWGNMVVAFSLYPLRLVGTFGFIMAALGLLYGLYTLVIWAIPDIPEPGEYQKLNASMWFFRGCTLLVMSIVGEYVGRIYMHLNSAPQYIIRQMLSGPVRNGARFSAKPMVARVNGKSRKEAAIVGESVLCH
ncbi:MAG: glycosyltransferase family 2 protein [Verrucomicrobiota bacterium]